MPTEFQKIMDTVFANCKNIFTFIDDILVSHRRYERRTSNRRCTKFCKSSPKAGFRLKAEKCQTAVKATEWQGFKLSPNGITPIQSKVQRITDRNAPQEFKTTPLTHGGCESIE